MIQISRLNTLYCIIDSSKMNTLKLTFDPRVQTLGPGLTHGPEDGEADGGSVLVRVAQLAVARHVSCHQARVGLRQELGQNLPAHYIHTWTTKC